MRVRAARGIGGVGGGGVVGGAEGGLEIGAFAADGDFGNEGGHGHFDVEFDDVGDRVELDVAG